MYSIDFKLNARKDLSKLPYDIQIRIISTLERIRIRPYAFVKKLVGEKSHCLRVGKYRVILEIDNGKMIVLVLKLGHRKEIYK